MRKLVSNYIKSISPQIEEATEIKSYSMKMEMDIQEIEEYSLICFRLAVLGWSYFIIANETVIFFNK